MAIWWETRPCLNDTFRTAWIGGGYHYYRQVRSEGVFLGHPTGPVWACPLWNHVFYKTLLQYLIDPDWVARAIGSNNFYLSMHRMDSQKCLCMIPNQVADNRRNLGCTNISSIICFGFCILTSGICFSLLLSYLFVRTRNRFTFSHISHAVTLTVHNLPVFTLFYLFMYFCGSIDEDGSLLPSTGTWPQVSYKLSNIAHLLPPHTATWCEILEIYKTPWPPHFENPKKPIKPQKQPQPLCFHG